jgi:3-phenylpropionate/trans-cinnamate dioxygenase ferredoxin component
MPRALQLGGPGEPLKSDRNGRFYVTTATTTREHTQLSEKVTVCAEEELPAGAMRLIEADGRKIGVFNCGGTLYAIEDRCSHDDGPLAEGEFDVDACTVECPRHGSLFDVTTGKPKTLPAYAPVQTFPVTVENDAIVLEVD